ncbi:hypothetical protein [Amycolatopsis alba]|uniref:Uncharacterized protein n=1 Tax=Amycolatopsis alba DSM 44262 TaxID=1125972 RepID=A0A229RBF3_AMYAL|nr:hypothetical protein [Amycolatopsis alba]OXM43791.1 hypothetical protein CFP75_37080 [Amycolatopsis alba DSM 44262]
MEEVHLMTDMMSGVENAEEPKPLTGLDGQDELLIRPSRPIADAVVSGFVRVREVLGHLSPQG